MHIVHDQEGLAHVRHLQWARCQYGIALLRRAFRAFATHFRKVIMYIYINVYIYISI
jgi:hypothetical protein